MRFDEFVEAHAPEGELERARFKRDLDQLSGELVADSELQWEPLDRDHDKSIAAIRAVYNNPEAGTWYSQSKRQALPVEEMAGGHLLNVARRLLFGPADARRSGKELKTDDAMRRAAAFFWVFDELAHRGLKLDGQPVEAMATEPAFTAQASPDALLAVTEKKERMAAFGLPNDEGVQSKLPVGPLDSFGVSEEGLESVKKAMGVEESEPDDEEPLWMPP